MKEKEYYIIKSDDFVFPPKIELYNKLLKMCNRDFLLLHKIGEGTYGEVYKAKAPKGKEVAIKVMAITPDKEYRISYALNEVILADKMSTLNLGPKIYDEFRCIFSDLFIQFIIMEYFDTEVRNFVNSKKNNVDDKINCNKKVLKLIKSQMFKHRIFCSDIKPSNMVINCSTLKTRLIDFGGDFCDNTVRNNTEMLILFHFIITQIVFLIIDNLSKMKYSRENIKNIIGPFMIPNLIKFLKDVDNMVVLFTKYKKNLVGFKHYCNIKSNNIKGTITKVSDTILFYS